MTDTITLRDAGLHFKDGWWFARRGMGGDVLMYRSGPMQVEPQLVLTIDANSWASIVASVSERGVDGERFETALAFHDKKRGTECHLSPTGWHHIDTSMESGPSNCFFCGSKMP